MLAVDDNGWVLKHAITDLISFRTPQKLEIFTKTDHIFITNHAQSVNN